MELTEKSTDMSTTYITQTIYQSDYRMIDADLMTAKDGEFVFYVPLVVNYEGDWASLNCEKLYIDGLDVEVKPDFNLAVQPEEELGRVNTDFPVYINYYTGNTAGEQDPPAWSDCILAGKYSDATATSSMKASYGNLVYKTILEAAPGEGEEIQLKDIRDKQNTTSTQDGFNLESSKVILQKGRVAICIKTKDFWCDPSSEVLKDTGVLRSNGAILRMLREKQRRLEGVREAKEEPEKKEREAPKRKCAKQNQPPTPTEPENNERATTRIYCNDPVIVDADESSGKAGRWTLKLKFGVHILSRYTIRYLRQ